MWVIRKRSLFGVAFVFGEEKVYPVTTVQTGVNKSNCLVGRVDNFWKYVMLSYCSVKKMLKRTGKVFHYLKMDTRLRICYLKNYKLFFCVIMRTRSGVFNKKLLKLLIICTIFALETKIKNKLLKSPFFSVANRIIHRFCELDNMWYRAYAWSKINQFVYNLNFFVTNMSHFIKNTGDV